MELFSEAFTDSFSGVRKVLRDDIATFKDQILTEIQKLREDITIVTGYKDEIEDHETRISKLEQILKS